jgi:glutathione S-transferase
MMRLYHSPTSPYVRKVMIVLHETGLADRVTLVNGGGSPIAPNAATAAANPLGKVPCLERDDGPAVFDSRVICRHLDTLHDGPRLYPAGHALTSTLTLEALADGVLDAAILMLYENRLRPEDKRFDPWLEGQKAKILRALDAVEALWIAHLEGPMDAAAIAVAATLGYLDFRFGALNWRDGRPKLAAWFEGWTVRPSFIATTPKDPA